MNKTDLIMLISILAIVIPLFMVISRAFYKLVDGKASLDVCKRDHTKIDKLIEEVVKKTNQHDRLIEKQNTMIETMSLQLTWLREYVIPEPPHSRV